MKQGSTPDAGWGRRVGSPEQPRSYATDSDPVQRLLAFAYQQTQKNRRDAPEELRKDSDTLSSVLAAQGRMAAAHFNLAEALGFIAEGACRLTGAGGAAIALREGQKVVCRGRFGLIAPELGACLNAESGVCGECLTTGEVQLCDDTEHDSRVDVWVCRNLGMRSILAVPLRRQEDVLGILVVFSGWAGVFAERDIRALRLLAGLALEALWANEAHQQTQELEPEAEPEPEPVAQQEAPEPSPDAISAALAEFRDEIASAVLPEPAAPVAEVEVEEASALVEAPLVEAPTEPPLVERASSTLALEPIAEVTPPGFAVLEDSEPRRVWRTLTVAAAILVVLAGATEAVFWRGAHLRQALHLRSAPPRLTAPVPPPETSAADASSPASTAEPAGNPAPEVAADSPPTASQLLSVRSWSKPEGTTLAFFLQAPPRWASGRLKDPDRIYFDLENTQLAADMLGKSREGLAIQVDDGVVQRVRVGPRESSAVRVVIDLAAPAEYSAVLSPTEPYRLMVAIRGTQPNKRAPANPQASKKVPSGETHSSAQARAALSHPKIVIDPGHGGSEDGAIGHGGLKEKDLTLGIAKRLGNLLASRLGAEVIYTRTSDILVPLEARAAIANEAAADLFISIHANSSDDPGARGVETYYVAKSLSPVAVALTAAPTTTEKPANEEYKLSESHKLAVEVQQAMYSAFGGAKGVPNRGVKQAPFVVLLDAGMPSILAEVAFVSNPADEQKLSTAEGQEAVAEALYKGVARYVAIAKRDKVVASMGGSTGQ